jgi:site-specific recombinase XerD
MRLPNATPGEVHLPGQAGSAVAWTPKCLKLNMWPTLDQALWAAGCFYDPFEECGHGTTLGEESLKKTIKGHGAWLSFLQAHGWLDASQHPAERVTRERLLSYFNAMRARGNRKYSILGRFIELRMAMKVMAPDHDTRFILRPNGVTVRQILSPYTRHMVVPDASVLFEWGIGLMDGAALDDPRRHGLVTFRDGLLIAMLASRGRRLRSMALLRLGRELTQREDRYRIELQPEQVKNKKYDAFNLPERLTSYIRQYIDTVRPALLRGNADNAFWVGLNGKQLKAKSIQAMVLNRSKARFGVAFGPHRFRHAIATTAPLRDPSHPGLAAPLLGISKGVVEANYNRANQVMAVQQYDAIIKGFV